VEEISEPEPSETIGTTSTGTRKKTQDLDHVVHNYLTGYLQCLNCGGEYNYNKALPAPISLGLVIMKHFGKIHKDCLTLTPQGQELREDNARAKASWDQQEKERKAREQQEDEEDEEGDGDPDPAPEGDSVRDVPEGV